MVVAVTTERVKLNLIDLDGRNAKRHPESQIDKIAASIKEFGYVNLLSVRTVQNSSSFQLIGGEGTLRALQRMFKPTMVIDVRVVHGLTDLQYARLGLALNKLGDEATYDTDTLTSILRDITAAGDDPTALGFSDAEVNKLLSEANPLEVREIETSEVHDEFWISIRGPLRHQAEALAKLQEVMAPYDEVTVELGTIAIG